MSDKPRQHRWLVVEDFPGRALAQGPFDAATAKVLCKLTDSDRHPEVILAATAAEAAEIYERIHGRAA